jgi:dimethylargininase
LRAVDVGAPDFTRLIAEHEAYIAAMSNAGVKVDVLPPLSEFPDSIFVEDPALTFPNGAILLRPGALTRRMETDHILSTLQYHFDNVLELPQPGFVEGGDVLRTPTKVMIGLSERTNQEGASALLTCLANLGLEGEIAQTSAEVLHFKTDCSLLDDETVFTTRRLGETGIFEGFRTIFVPEGEEAAANALRVNDVVMIGVEFRRSLDLLDGLGYKLLPLATSEIGKIDAGLSCMSLRW